jgi:hypothetical protein
VATDWPLVPADISFHNCITKHHVPFFGIFLLVWPVATRAGSAGNFRFEPASLEQDDVVVRNVDSIGAGDAGQGGDLMEQPGYDIDS